MEHFRDVAVKALNSRSTSLFSNFVFGTTIMEKRLNGFFVQS